MNNNQEIDCFWLVTEKHFDDYDIWDSDTK